MSRACGKSFQSFLGPFPLRLIRTGFWKEKAHLLEERVQTEMEFAAVISPTGRTGCCPRERSGANAGTVTVKSSLPVLVPGQR
jgi:hypothetical protein